MNIKKDRFTLGSSNFARNLSMAHSSITEYYEGEPEKTTLSAVCILAFAVLGKLFDS